MLSKLKVLVASVIITSSFSISASDPVTYGSATSANYNLYKHSAQNFDLQCMSLDKLNAIKGMCFWLKIKLFSVETKTSMIIEHRMPDLQVRTSTTQRDSVLPYYDFYDDLVSPLAKALNFQFANSNVRGIVSGVDIQGGSRGGARRRGRNQGNKLNFYDVQVVGNPYLPLYEMLLESVMDSLEIGSSCASKVTAFQPYYNSKVDPEWRWGFLERGASLLDSIQGIITGTRNLNNTPFEMNLSDPAGSLNEMNSYLSNPATGAGVHWGHIYPRMGFVKNQSQYRSAALTAFRAVDLSTNWNGLHIPQGQWPPTEPNTRSRKVWPIPKVHEDSPEDHKFQLNFPQIANDGCYNFPDKDFDKNLVTTDMSPTESDLSQKNEYIWTLWRKYKCCQKKGQIFLGKVEW